MGVGDILDTLGRQDAADGDRRIRLRLPAGYIPLPVRGAPAKLVEVEPVLRELCPPESRALLSATLVTFATLLAELEVRNAVYCGLGRHTSPTDGTLVSSSLVVSVQDTGMRRNPRLVLGDLVTAAANAGDRGRADLVDLPGGPALFSETVRTLRRPALPGDGGSPGTADVYQLQATVPAAKGDSIAVLEFSTPQVEYGPLYREMMLLLANSVSFTPPPGPAPDSASAQHIHDLLEGSSA